MYSLIHPFSSTWYTVDPGFGIHGFFCGKQLQKYLQIISWIFNVIFLTKYIFYDKKCTFQI